MMERMNVTESFHGIVFPGHLHTEKSLRFAEDFHFEDTDIVIATYPKSGTTWMQEIVTLISSNGDPFPAQTIPNWARAPWLEQFYSKDVLKDRQGIRILTTHLPYDILASALKKSKARVIYIARNPKDVVVSFYHFHRMANFLPDPGTFDEFLEKFLLGTVHFGSWFEHIKGWLSHKEEFNFLYITYEEMQQDLRQSVEHVCKFLDVPLRPEAVDSVLKYCSFSAMSKNAMVNYTLIPTEIMDHQKGKFMRKGKTGDWKEYFSDKQLSLFQNIFEYEMQGLSKDLLIHLN
ncbi:sulfotransferase 2B1-like [Protopterus annectens]|uniref:sulfotransferase 2B1-like n=1 Tax=Protopterus annectens TaxID=7888 RepID=UPI001CFA2493|nr:sulfotransferase 2B1-like [Protopterus annectens]